MNPSLRKLGDVLQISRGGSPRPIEDYITEDENGLNWIKIGDVEVGAKYITHTKEKIKKEGLSKTRQVKAGDFLLSNSMSFGRPYITKIDGCIHDGWLSLRDEKKIFNTDFLYHVLNSNAVKEQFRKYASGAVVKNLNIDAVSKVVITIPSLEEQQRIATLLDTADQIIILRKSAIDKLDQLAQSMFACMFGNPINNEKKWVKRKLGSLVSKIGSGATPAGGDAAYKESGISLIRSLNVHDGKFKFKNLAFIDEEQAKKLSNVSVCEDDILLNITGASVARVCRVPKTILPARVNQHVMIIRPKEHISSAFLERLLLNNQMKSKLLSVSSAGATREAITKSSAEDLDVICPPMDLQNEFEAKLGQIQLLKNKMLDEVDVLLKIQLSLQHQSFAVN